METIKIGLCGVGNVGGEVARRLLSHDSLLNSAAGTELKLVQIGARKGKGAISLDNVDIRTDLRDVVANPDIDVFVELIGGVDLAYELVTDALNNGKHVVTANKALISTHGNEIFKLAKEKNLQIGFEASVAGGTPVIKALREGLVANEVSWFAGILNGTSNYILSDMQMNGAQFSEALSKAQNLGLAESDPTLDINGTDAAQKASILASLAFGVPLDFSNVSFTGIDELELIDLNFATELGYTIKHIAYGEIENSEVTVSAHPTLVSNESILSQVGKEMNALEINCKGIGSTVYYGPGAGPSPTASAVLADLVDVSKGSLACPELNKESNVYSKEDKKVFARYFRLLVKDEPGVIAKISSLFAENNLSIEALIQHEDRNKSDDINKVPVVILSGPVNDASADKISKSLIDLDEVDQHLKQYRIHSDKK